MKKNGKTFNLNTEVTWKWMGKEIVGFIQEIHTNSISKTIKGKTIKRNGTKENPAYLVQSKAGNLALKLQSELELFKTENSKVSRPKLFRN